MPPGSLPSNRRATYCGSVPVAARASALMRAASACERRFVFHFLDADDVGRQHHGSDRQRRLAQPALEPLSRHRHVVAAAVDVVEEPFHVERRHRELVLGRRGDRHGRPVAGRRPGQRIRQERVGRAGVIEHAGHVVDDLSADDFQPRRRRVRRCRRAGARNCRRTSAPTGGVPAGTFCAGSSPGSRAGRATPSRTAMKSPFETDVAERLELRAVGRPGGQEARAHAHPLEAFELLRARAGGRVAGHQLNRRPAAGGRSTITTNAGPPEISVVGRRERDRLRSELRDPTADANGVSRRGHRRAEAGEDEQPFRREPDCRRPVRRASG